ncbi:integrase catalytic domain-containing protein [Trichonephila clavipes]|nr:integrase catalytic domain-containing protein [Trichonephila clavipes]
MFLREIPESGVPNIDTVDREKLSKRAKYLQKMRQQLRPKFQIEYLGQLRQQSIKNYKDNPLSMGEIVLLEDNSKKRAYWSLARVLKLIPGCDGHIRLALIKTEHSEFLRPVQRLFRLELDNPVGKVNDVIRVYSTSSGRIVKTLKRLKCFCTKLHCL